CRLLRLRKESVSRDWTQRPSGPGPPGLSSLTLRQRRAKRQPGPGLWTIPSPGNLPATDGSDRRRPERLTVRRTSVAGAGRRLCAPALDAGLPPPTRKSPADFVPGFQRPGIEQDRRARPALGPLPAHQTGRSNTKTPQVRVREKTCLAWSRRATHEESARLRCERRSPFTSKAWGWLANRYRQPQAMSQSLPLPPSPLASRRAA